MANAMPVSMERLESLYVDGMELPYVDLGDAEPTVELVHRAKEYALYRTVPLRGYSGVLGRHVRELMAQGKEVFLARFGTRIYIYATGLNPLGAGKAPG